MKNLIFGAVLTLAVTLFISVMPTEADGAIYEDTVRLHILASSNEEEDQELKLKLRDAILERYGRELSAFESVEAATDSLEKRLLEIEEYSNETIASLGYSYTSRVTLGVEWYDTREYENFTLPCGYYTSLKVIIGEGEGKNWWCVMFPPLCLDAATSNAAYSESEELLITKKYNVKFKILELVSQMSK